MRTEHIKIAGMDNAGCAAVIMRAMKAMGGVRSVHVSFVASDATIEYDETITSPALLKLTIMGAGYEVGEAIAA